MCYHRYMKIPIVNEQDEILYYKEREDVTQDELCRVTALWITDTSGKILLAQRGLHKKRHGGKWGPAVAGTVEEGETYESNILKEIEEEIGLKNVPLSSFPPSLINTSDYSFFGQLFFLTLPEGYNNFSLEDQQVEQVKWFTSKEVEEMYIENPNMFIPSFGSLSKSVKEFYANQN